MNSFSNYKIQFSILFGTILLLLVSVFWVDLLSQITKQYNLFKNPLINQIIITILLTIIAFIFLLIFKPFNLTTTKVPTGEERAVVDDRIIKDIHI